MANTVPDRMTRWQSFAHSWACVALRRWVGGLILSLGCGVGLAFPLAASGPPDLSNTIPILEDRFDTPLSRHDGTRGVWSTLPLRRQLMINSEEGAFWDQGVLDPVSERDIPPTIAQSADGLLLRTVVMPPSAQAAVRRYMGARGQGDRAAQVRYLSGQINTQHSWAQRYGYIEVVARIPRGQGRWPAAWMRAAGPDWPPELDLFEAYGKGLDSPAGRDDRFHMAVHFDAVSRPGEPPLSTDVVNPFGDGAPQPPNFVDDFEGGHLAFQAVFDARADLGADIYSDFHTYAALWTPDDITFYFGATRADLRPVFRTPTPPDLHAPMFFIANDHFTAERGWWPANPQTVDRVLDPDNALVIRSVVLRALRPTRIVSPGDPDPGDSVLQATPADEVLRPGTGFDVVVLGGGADIVEIERGRLPKILDGFGADDRVDLIGFPFRDGTEAHAHLTQVGADVWLISGADPHDPMTVVFRNTRIEAIAPAQLRPRWPVGLNEWAIDAARDPYHRKADAAGQTVVAYDYGTRLSDGAVPARLVGGPGADLFHQGHRDSVIDPGAGEGLDSLLCWVPCRAPNGIVRVIASGTGLRVTGADGDERLVAQGDRLTLVGGAGDDLYVLQDGVQTTVQIARGAGHDRITGLAVGDRIRLAAPLLATRSDWRVVRDGQDTVIWFSGQQSLRLSRTSALTALAVLPELGDDIAPAGD